jgi:hypothetical protein
MKKEEEMYQFSYRKQREIHIDRIRFYINYLTQLMRGDHLGNKYKMKQITASREQIRWPINALAGVSSLWPSQPCTPLVKAQHFGNVSKVEGYYEHVCILTLQRSSSHPLLLSRHKLPPLLSACICHQSHKL